MTKDLYVKGLAEKLDKPKSEVEELLKFIKEYDIKMLIEHLDIPTSFGKAKVKETKARMVLINPRQPELGKREKKASHKVTYTVSKEVKELISNL